MFRCPLNVDRLVALISSLGRLVQCLALLLPNLQFKPVQHSTSLLQDFSFKERQNMLGFV